MTSNERKEKRYFRRKLKRKIKREEFLNQYNDFSLITDPNNLYQAFMKSKKGVSWKTSIQRYEINILRNIAKTIYKLENGIDVAHGFMEFDLRERGKVRHIKSIHISERTVQKCLCDQILVPVLSHFLIYDNGASIKNKGVHFSVKRLITHLTKYFKEYKKNKGYCLQIDFSRYFDRIIHEYLLNMIKKYFKDKKVLKLIHDFIVPFGDGISLGLGSQVSQISAVFYVNVIDHMIKDIFRIKYFTRYMDDLVLIIRNKKQALNMLNVITEECEKLKIKINKKKTRITKLENGLLYLKGIYKLTQSGKIIKIPTSNSRKRMKKKLFKLKKILNNNKITTSDVYASYQSWRGNYRKRFNAFYTIKRMDGLYNRLFIYNHSEENYG
jgi:hypothetical protein